MGRYCTSHHALVIAQAIAVAMTIVLGIMIALAPVSRSSRSASRIACGSTLCQIRVRLPSNLAPAKLEITPSSNYYQLPSLVSTSGTYVLQESSSCALGLESHRLIRDRPIRFRDVTEDVVREHGNAPPFLQALRGITPIRRLPRHGHCGAGG